MGRVSIFVAIVLMLSAISLVTARYQSRQLFIESERTQAQMRELETAWRRLQLDRAEYARNSRVDEAASGELGMLGIVPDRTLYLNQPKQSAGVSQPGVRQ